MSQVVIHLVGENENDPLFPSTMYVARDIAEDIGSDQVIMRGQLWQRKCCGSFREKILYHSWHRCQGQERKIKMLRFDDFAFSVEAIDLDLGNNGYLEFEVSDDHFKSELEMQLEFERLKKQCKEQEQ